MTYKENIRAILECYFAGFKEEIIDSACNRILEQEPCKDCCNGNQIEKAKLCQKSYLAGMEHKQEPKTGHWIPIQETIGVDKEGNEMSAIVGYMCSECGERHQVKSYYCRYCGARMVEPQESEG